MSRVLVIALAIAGLSGHAAPTSKAGAAGARATRPTAPRIESGEINGAPFTLARPSNWNRQVLLLAPGARNERRPPAADLSPLMLDYQLLLDEGWLIAATGYRRAGVAIADAMADLDALRARIVERHGPPERVVVAGESMGGLVATLVAEREPTLDEAGHPAYAGALAIGPTLHLRDPSAPLALSLEPKIPLLFLANQSEFEAPRQYVTADVARPSGLRPALLRIARNGPANVNPAERLAAWRALLAWLDRGRSAVPRSGGGVNDFFDATVAPTPRPSQVAMDADGRGFSARVLAISPRSGIVTLSAQPADFAAAGIGLMHWFQVLAHNQTLRVLHGRDFSRETRGTWVAIPNADGFYWLGHNLTDPGAAARLAVGDTVTVRRYDDPSPKNF